MFSYRLFLTTAMAWVCLTPILALPGKAGENKILIDDFTEPPDDGWSRFELAPPPYSFVVDGKYRLKTTDPVGIDQGLGAWWTASEDGSYSEGFVQAKIRTDSMGPRIGPVMRWTTDAGYFFLGDSSHKRFGILQWTSVSNGQQQQYLLPDLEFDAEEVWNIEGGAVGERLSMKVWPEGHPEPTIPQLVAHDPQPIGNAEFGLLSYIDTGSAGATIDATFDDVYFTPSVPGDLNYSGHLDAGDLDALSAALTQPDYSMWFDLNFDQRVDQTDRRIWVKDLKDTWFGDANLDGKFNSDDLIIALANGTYETDIDAGWASGDFDGSGRFDSGDLVFALADGGYEQGVRVATVPEPSSLLALIVGLLGTAIRSTKRSTRVSWIAPTSFRA